MTSKMPEVLYESNNFKGVFSDDYQDLYTNIVEEYGEDANNEEIFDNWYTEFQLVEFMVTFTIYKDDKGNYKNIIRENDGTYSELK